MLEQKSLEILKSIDDDAWIISDPHFNHDKVVLFEPSRLNLILEHPELPEKYVSMINTYLTQTADIKDHEEIWNNIDTLINFHNEALIHNWNRNIKEKDIVICIGDFAWKGTQQILPKLNGNKILILGNHDRSGANSYPGVTVVRGLIEVIKLKNRRIIMKEVIDKSDKLFSALIINNMIFSHYPISEYEKTISGRGNNEFINKRIDKLMEIVDNNNKLIFNFHGHTHSRNIDESGEKYSLTYFNCSCENINFTPKKLKDF